MGADRLGSYHRSLPFRRSANQGGGRFCTDILGYVLCARIVSPPK
jgi:hypothetical protein